MQIVILTLVLFGVHCSVWSAHAYEEGASALKLYGAQVIESAFADTEAFEKKEILVQLYKPQLGYKSVLWDVSSNKYSDVWPLFKSNFRMCADYGELMNPEMEFCLRKFFIAVRAREDVTVVELTREDCQDFSASSDAEVWRTVHSDVALTSEDCLYFSAFCGTRVWRVVRSDSALYTTVRIGLPNFKFALDGLYCRAV